MLTDKEWHITPYDKKTLEGRCTNAGLPPIVGYVNRKPVFVGLVDWEQVSIIMRAVWRKQSNVLATPEPEPVPEPPTPKKRRRGRPRKKQD